MKRIKRWTAALLVAALSFCFTSGAHAVQFKDVEKGTWYYDAVSWAVQYNITNGASATTFSPNETCTRAQFLTMLWRDSGCPKPSESRTVFEDVKASAYYAEAVAWAAQKGICTGSIVNGHRVFKPENGVTRAEAVTFLWRALGSRVDMETVHPFNDVPSGAYYETAVLWMRDFGIVDGTGNGCFSPNKTCTRAEAVTLLYRISCKNLAGMGTPSGTLPFRGS